MAAVSVFKDCTANRGLDGILHSMFNIEDKLQDSHVKIESTGQQFSINSFFQTAVSSKNVFIKILFYLK